MKTPPSGNPAWPSRSLLLRNGRRKPWGSLSPHFSRAAAPAAFLRRVKSVPAGNDRTAEYCASSPLGPGRGENRLAKFRRAFSVTANRGSRGLAVPLATVVLVMGVPHCEARPHHGGASPSKG